MPEATDCEYVTLTITAMPDGALDFQTFGCCERAHHRTDVQTEGIGGRVWRTCCRHYPILLAEVEATAGYAVRLDAKITPEIRARVAYDKTEECWVYRLVINDAASPAVRLQATTWREARNEADAIADRLRSAAEGKES